MPLTLSGIPQEPIPLSGEYNSIEAILGYFAKFATLSQGQFRVELVDVLANESRVAVITRDTATRNGKTMSWEGGVIFQMQDGKLQSAQAFNFDQAAVDAFWTA